MERVFVSEKISVKLGINYLMSTSKIMFGLLLQNGLEFVRQENLERYVPFADSSELAWYGLASVTDMWQPVDSDVAQTLKLLTALFREQRRPKWFANEKTFSAMERRILLTHWKGEAWRKFTEDEKYK